jgi:hypothetical protein
MQDSFSLVEQACRGVRPPRMPVFDLLANDAIIEHFAGVPLNGKDDEKVVKKAAASALDATRCITIPNQQARTWIDPAGNTRISDRWTSWLQTPAYADVEGWACWMKRYVEQENAESNAPSLIQLDLTEHGYDTVKASALRDNQLGFNRTLGGTVNIFCTLSTSLNALIYYIGLETLSFLWMDFRDLCRHWINVYRRKTIHYIRMHGHCQTSPLAMIYCDIAYKNGLMFSKTMLREMDFFTELQEISDACHKAGHYVIFHSDGNIMDLLNDVAATGIDGLNPIETAAGMDIYEIRRRYPQLILVGGMDVTNLLRTGSCQEIRGETRNMIEKVGAEGRFLIGSSTEVGNDVPLNNYLAFHQEVMRDQ